MKRMRPHHTRIAEMQLKTGSFEDNRLVHVHLSSNYELFGVLNQTHHQDGYQAYPTAIPDA